MAIEVCWLLAHTESSILSTHKVVQLSTGFGLGLESLVVSLLFITLSWARAVRQRYLMLTAQKAMKLILKTPCTIVARHKMEANVCSKRIQLCNAGKVKDYSFWGDCCNILDQHWNHTFWWTAAFNGISDLINNHHYKSNIEMYLMLVRLLIRCWS